MTELMAVEITRVQREIDLDEYWKEATIAH